MTLRTHDRLEGVKAAAPLPGDDGQVAQRRPLLLRMPPNLLKGQPESNVYTYKVGFIMSVQVI